MTRPHPGITARCDVEECLPPPELPSPGISIVAEFVRARDGDTIEWKLPGSAFVWASRLIGVWCYETDSKNETERRIGLKAKEFVASECKAAGVFGIFVPFGSSIKQPLKALTFDRIPSYVYLDGECLNEAIIRAGFGSSKKGGELGT